MDCCRAALIVCILLIAGCTSPDESNAEQEVDQPTSESQCNGSVILCERSYDNVTFPETHNSFATHQDGIFYPASNHETGLNAQWDAGIRAFMLDTHYNSEFENDADNVAFCHGSSDDGYSPCRYGEVNPWQWLSILKGKMASAPRDIVTLLIENHVSGDHLKSLFDHVNLTPLMYIHKLNEDWPTLQSLIDLETRLVVFWEQPDDPSHPEFHDFLTHSWTTSYAEDDTSDMDCSVHRGDGTQSVFHMNNWLSGPLGLSDPFRADEANDPSFMFERALDCIELHGKRPTFIAVDWWDDGDVVAAATMVNELEI